MYMLYQFVIKDTEKKFEEILQKKGAIVVKVTSDQLLFSTDNHNE